MQKVLVENNADGTTAPWLILIGLKTLADVQRPARPPVV